MTSQQRQTISYVRWMATVMGASARKEWRIRKRYPLMLWSFLLWPFLFAFGLILTARAMAGPEGNLEGFVRTAGTSQYTPFLGLGVATWMAMNWILWSFGLSLRREQMGGTLEALWMTPVPRVVLTVGRGLWEVVFAFLVFGLSLIEFMLIFGMPWRGHMVPLTIVLLASVPSLYGLGVGFASLVLWVKEANGAVFLVRGIFTIFAGLTYPLSVLPDWMRSVAVWLPLTHTVDGVRLVGMRGASVAELGPVLVPLLGLDALFIVLGQLAFAWSERRVRHLGTMGAF